MRPERDMTNTEGNRGAVGNSIGDTSQQALPKATGALMSQDDEIKAASAALCIESAVAHRLP